MIADKYCCFSKS